jgi:alcohol dehydrogenase class IV
VVLPYVLALNAPAVPDLERRMAAAFGAPTALDGVQRLRDRVHAPRALRDHGLHEDDVPAAVHALAAAVPPGNPTPVTAGDLERLLYAALNGEEPRTLTAVFPGE